MSDLSNNLKADDFLNFTNKSLRELAASQSAKVILQQLQIQQLQSELAQVKHQSLESIQHHKDSIQAKKEVIELLKQQLAEVGEANREIQERLDFIISKRGRTVLARNNAPITKPE